MIIGLSIVTALLFLGAWLTIKTAPKDREPADREFRENAAIALFLTGVLCVGIILGMSSRF